MDAVKQRTDALAKANRYRYAVAEKRREIAGMSMAEGCKELADLIEHTDCPMMLSGQVSHWLMCPNRAGVRKASQAMACLNIRKADRRLRDLSPRQRQELAEIVRHRLNVREWRRHQLLEQVA
jgi:hypothetical protein